MRVSLIANTTDAGVRDALRAEVRRLRDDGAEVEARLTFEAGDARRFAREAAEAGASLVIAAGGDGTVHEVVNGFDDHLGGGAATGPLPRLGIVPLGTGNDLAAALEIPAEVPAAVRTAVEGRVRELDLGRVEDRCFINVSTGGIGAEATEETPAEAKRALGALAYAITGARKFVSLQASSARFVAEEVVHDGPFLLFAVGNSGRTGGGNWLTPRADPSDGLLDLCIVREVSRLDLLKLLPELRGGTHLGHPAVIYRQVSRLRVEAHAELSVNADGEPLSGTRFHYSLAPYRVSLMVPAEKGAPRSA